MNAISISRQISQKNAVVVYDVGRCIRSWGRRGILSGGIFGFALGAIFVAIPFTTDVLTFGTIGTLIVGTVECAVIAGAFGAFAAALYGQGTLRGNTAGLDRTFATNRLSAAGNWREADILGRFAAYQPYEPILVATNDRRDITDNSLPLLRPQLSTINSWDDEGSGP